MNAIQSSIQQVSKKESFMFSPSNIDEVIRFAEYIKHSVMVPQRFRGNSADIVMCMLKCLRLGLDPISGMQHIKVFNDKITMDTDAVMALVMGNPEFEDMEETFDEVTMTATCTVKRKRRTPVTKIFSKKDAVIAGLWDKPKTPWVTYPIRMLQMRARGFALRDMFNDVIEGILPYEEVADYNMENDYIDNKPKKAMKQEPKIKTVEPIKVDVISVNKEKETVVLEPVFNKIEEFAKREINETPFEKKLKEMEKAMEAEIEDETIQTILKTKIEEKNIPETTVEKWLRKANVDDVINLSDYAANKCLQYVNTNY